MSLPRNLSTLVAPNIYPSNLNTHGSEKCDGRTCIFHRPSDHHMRGWDINVRLDRFGSLAERICPHGIGHPDPDSLAYVESLREPDDRGYDGIHGCDGCCHREQG